MPHTGQASRARVSLRTQPRRTLRLHLLDVCPALAAELSLPPRQCRGTRQRQLRLLRCRQTCSSTW
eukprot:363769-Chlamydomonas_euryale.AAC.1